MLIKIALIIKVKKKITKKAEKLCPIENWGVKLTPGIACSNQKDTPDSVISLSLSLSLSPLHSLTHLVSPSS
jgi:hypothetical protein